VEAVRRVGCPTFPSDRNRQAALQRVSEAISNLINLNLNLKLSSHPVPPHEHLHSTSPPEILPTIRMRVLPTPTTALRASKSLVPVYATRGFANTRAVRAGASEYDPPSGWLWGVKPGEKPPQEGWENIWVYGFFGSLVAGAVGYAFKPDTS